MNQKEILKDLIEFITDCIKKGNIYDYVMYSNKLSDRVKSIEIHSEGCVHIHTEKFKTRPLIFANLEIMESENGKEWRFYSEGAGHFDCKCILRYEPRSF